MGFLDRIRGFARTKRLGDTKTETTIPTLSQATAEPKDAPGNRRIIKTGRTGKEINDAALLGFWPLVKPAIPGENIHVQIAIFQDPATGLIHTASDARGREKGEMVIPFMLYYPYHFPNPFAAYLIPADIAVGEEVWLEDLIEDLVAVWGNQGYQPRLDAAPAIWNGTDFEILFDPERDADIWIG